jgi:hypothetical protein
LKDLVVEGEERVMVGASWARAGRKEIAAVRTRTSCSFTWGVRKAVFRAVTNRRLQQTVVAATPKAVGLFFFVFQSAKIVDD